MNILVVDDDALIRNWLSLLLRQAEGSDLTLYEATDGVNALEFCSNHSVDLVITDIKMPRMNGIDLISALKGAHPQIRTAVLSSYDDFDYVRIALKCGALDYIRKAEMQMDDIVSLLEKLRRAIAQEKSTPGQEQKPLTALTEMKQIFIEYLENSQQTQVRFRSAMGPYTEDAPFCLVFLRLKKPEGTEVLRYMVSSICDDTLRHEGYAGTAFPWGREYFTMFYPATSPIVEDQHAEYQKLLVLLDHNLDALSSFQIDNSIHMVCRQGECLRSVFAQALDIMDFRQYYGCPAPQPLPETPSGRKAQATQIQKALEIKDYLQATTVLKQHLAQAHAVRMVPRKIKQLVVSGMNALLSAIALVEHKSDVLDRLDTYPTVVMQAYQKGRLELATNRFCAQFLSHVQHLPPHLSPNVREAVRYIEANYPNKLTMDEVASAVFLNRSYLSLLFKKEMGVSFGDYLESYRVEKAKQLIRSGSESMSEIAEKVGFSNQNYFAKVFKKATGVSPLKFRRYE